MGFTSVFGFSQQSRVLFAFHWRALFPVTPHHPSATVEDESECSERPFFLRFLPPATRQDRGSGSRPCPVPSILLVTMERLQLHPHLA